MKKIDFHIVALPKTDDLKILNELRNYFYLNDFRFSNKPNRSDAHITLAQGSCPETQIQDLHDLITDKLKNWKPFTISYTKVTNDKRGPVEGKYEFDNCWVALLYDDENLRSLNNEIDLVLQQMNISTTDKYSSKILNELYNGEDIHREVIANHINLCNHCRPERSEEAKTKVEREAPKEITIDRIAFRIMDASLAWIISLDKNIKDE